MPAFTLQTPCAFCNAQVPSQYLTNRVWKLHLCYPSEGRHPELVPKAIITLLKCDWLHQYEGWCLSFPSDSEALFSLFSRTSLRSFPFPLLSLLPSTSPSIFSFPSLSSYSCCSSSSFSPSCCSSSLSSLNCFHFHYTNGVLAWFLPTLKHHHGKETKLDCLKS